MRRKSVRELFVVGPDAWGNRFRIVEVGPEDPRGIRIELRQEADTRDGRGFQYRTSVRLPPALLAEALERFARSGPPPAEGAGSSEEASDGREQESGPDGAADGW